MAKLNQISCKFGRYLKLKIEDKGSEFGVSGNCF